MDNKKRFFILILSSIPSFLFALYDTTADRRVLKVKSTTDFTITGDGSAENWKHTDWNIITQRSSKVLRKAGWNIPAEHTVIQDLQYKTHFKILYSEKGIYCLYQCEDSIITATLKKDYLNLFDEDVVEAFFRPDTSIPVYFEYELSPLNFELPLLVFNRKGNMTGWTPWQYEGVRKIIHAITIHEINKTDNRLTWTAEFFIPFALLQPSHNIPPKKGSRWLANFYRIDYDRTPAYSSWQLTRKDFHDYEKFGTLEFE